MTNAEIIIGPSGAAFANIMFCKSDAKILIFIPKYKYTSYWYWQNIACASGKKISYILGEEEATTIHDPMSINFNNILDFIRESE